MDTHFVNYRWIGNRPRRSLHAPLHQDHDVEQERATRPSTTKGVARVAMDPGREDDLRADAQRVPGKRLPERVPFQLARAGTTRSRARSPPTRARPSPTPPRPRHAVATTPLSVHEGRAPTATSRPATSCARATATSTRCSALSRRGPSRSGTCIMRTRDLSDPTSWRAWNGTAFVVQFANPYIGTIEPGRRTSARRWTPSASGRSARASRTTPTSGSGCWSAQSVGDPAFNKPPGRLLRALGRPAQLDQRGRCCSQAEISMGPRLHAAGPDQGSVAARSRPAPRATSRPSGQRGQLFYTHYHLSGCNGTLDRDLIRIPIEFSNQQPGGPSAALTASTSSAAGRRAGAVRRLRLDATRTGTVTRFQWDLDGDGGFERDTGSNPVDRPPPSRPPSR